jgi:hypothetical protein
MWRSVGFFMTFAVVLMSLAIVAYVIILCGGKKIRETGWQILSTIIVMSVAVQVASMALVVCISFSPFYMMVVVANGLGVPLRQRRALLRRLGARQVLRLLHCELVHLALLCDCGHRGGAHAAS